jgi:hypothetical protein
VHDSEWVVHPNRSEIGPDEPGRNGHFRAVAKPQADASTDEPCVAQILLPDSLSHLADSGQLKLFSASDWSFVVCVAHTFAREHTDVEMPPPFGFKDRGLWWWWDGTTTEESILEGQDAAGYVEEFLERLFPGMAITVIDEREPAATEA